ncbi:MAG: sec-independent protein translocase protein TatC [Pseudomonadota bacterium]|nr:sec-independent protein translocase protein TatC [Pseudomonadota bacterium]
MNQELINHLIELRKRVILILFGFIIIFLSLFHFANQIYASLSKPLFSYLPLGTKLIATDITSPFFVPLKLTAIVAFVIALPNTIYQTWQFIAPGLYKRERRLLAGVVIFGLILFFLGIIFCYFIVLPTLFNFISRIKASDIEMFTDISKYLDLVLNLFLVFGISFQLPILIFLLINFNVITHHKLSSLRKYVLVGVFILAAIITPPDVLSQTLLAIPLYILYEIGMFAGKIFSRSYTLI